MTTWADGTAVRRLQRAGTIPTMPWSTFVSTRPARDPHFMLRKPVSRSFPNGHRPLRTCGQRLQLRFLPDECKIGVPITSQAGGEIDVEAFAANIVRYPCPSGGSVRLPGLWFSIPLFTQTNSPKCIAG